jgi:two-component system response regulator PilR (NtrC family)
MRSPALKAGAFDYISKPVSLEQLRGIVKSALDLPGADPRRPRPSIPGLLGESPAIARGARA